MLEQKPVREEHKKTHMLKERGQPVNAVMVKDLRKAKRCPAESVLWISRHKPMQQRMQPLSQIPHIMTVPSAWTFSSPLSCVSTFFPPPDGMDCLRPKCVVWMPVSVIISDLETRESVLVQPPAAMISASIATRA